MSRGQVSEARPPARKTDSADVVAAHPRIDKAAEYLKNGQAQAALNQLEALRRELWNRLDPREKYRVLANIGNARFQLGDKNGAARAYLRAKEYQPHDEDARAYEALAYYYSEDVQRAHALASALCKEYPTHSRAHFVRVVTSGEQVSWDELIDSIPGALRSDAEIAVALYQRASRASHLEVVERLLRSARGRNGSWAPVSLALGSTILQQEVQSLRVTYDGPRVANPARVSEAVDLFSEALENLDSDDINSVEFAAHLHRGEGYRLLEKHDLADGDFTKAHELKPDNERAILALARSAYPYGSDVDGAIRILDDHVRSHRTPEAMLLLGEFLRQRGNDGDLERSIGLFESLRSLLSQIGDHDARADVVAAMATAYSEAGQPQAAIELLEDVPESILSASTRHAICGEVQRFIGNTEEAVAQAETAKQRLGDSTEWQDCRRIASLLECLGRFDAALDIWRRIVVPDFVAPETYGMLFCASKAGQHEFAIDFCRQLRENGQHDRRLVLIEVDLLARYSEFGAARAALENYLAARPDDKLARVHLTLLALDRGWEDAIESDPTLLPSLEEIDGAEAGLLVTQVLRGTRPDAAADYAYELYRRFPSDSSAHIALILSVWLPGSADAQVQRPDTVAPGTAVCYEGGRSDEKRWIVVEDGAHPSLARNEFGVSHPVVQALLGKRPGDDFSFPGGVREVTGVIVDVQDKRVYRAQELAHSWTDRFPDTPFIDTIPVGGSDTPSHEDFAELLEVLTRQDKRRSQLEEAYNEGKLPVSSFALLGGHSVFDTITYLAANQNTTIRACTGTSTDLELAQAVLNAAQTVVLCPSAVATLAILDVVEVLDVLPFRCLLTEGTLDEVRNLTRHSVLSERGGGFIGARDGKLWLQEIDAKEDSERRDRLGKITGSLEYKCEVIGGVDVAGVEAADREHLLDVVARPALEAAAAANKRHAILWSDDYLLHEFMSQRLPSPYVWTQAVVIWAHTKGLLGRTSRSAATAQLLRYGYTFTSSSAFVVLDTCEASFWWPEDPNLRAVFADFGNAAWDSETAFSMTADTVSRVWREAPSVEHARSVTTSLLAQLAERPDFAKIVSTLLSNAEALLGLAVTRLPNLTAVLRASLQSHVARS